MGSVATTRATLKPPYFTHPRLFTNLRWCKVIWHEAKAPVTDLPLLGLESRTVSRRTGRLRGIALLSGVGVRGVNDTFRKWGFAQAPCEIK
jgi:hypothetical protein